jgi:hypothetical protein
MEPIRCPETSVKDYHSTLRNIPEERRAHQHRGGSLKSRLAIISQYKNNGLDFPNDTEFLCEEYSDILIFKA